MASGEFPLTFTPKEEAILLKLPNELLPLLLSGANMTFAVYFWGRLMATIMPRRILAKATAR